jgi:hypothetical protein
MYYGYATYLPDFGSDVDTDYVQIMWFHFSVLGIASALVTFYLSKAFLLSFKVSLVTFIVAGIVFNLYSPEGNQYHWMDGVYELLFLYMLFGVSVLVLFNSTKKAEQKSPNKPIKRD